MTIQALIAFLVSLPRRQGPSQPSIDDSGVPRWEKNPAEQRYLRDRDREDAARWLRLPRGY